MPDLYQKEKIIMRRKNKNGKQYDKIDFLINVITVIISALILTYLHGAVGIILLFFWVYILMKN